LPPPLSSSFIGRAGFDERSTTQKQRSEDDKVTAEREEDEDNNGMPSNDDSSWLNTLLSGPALGDDGDKDGPSDDSAVVSKEEKRGSMNDSAKDRLQDLEHADEDEDGTRLSLNDQGRVVHRRRIPFRRPPQRQRYAGKLVLRPRRPCLGHFPLR